MNKYLKNRSLVLLITTLCESGVCIWSLFYFNYLDRLNYQESVTSTTSDLALLIQNMFTSTWWALIILTLSIITICSLTSFIYKDLKLHFISLCLWAILFILALNFKDSLVNNLSTVAIFIPIYAINIYSYLDHKKKI